MEHFGHLVFDSNVTRIFSVVVLVQAEVIRIQRTALLAAAGARISLDNLRNTPTLVTGLIKQTRLGHSYHLKPYAKDDI